MSYTFSSGSSIGQHPKIPAAPAIPDKFALQQWSCDFFESREDSFSQVDVQVEFLSQDIVSTIPDIVYPVVLSPDCLKIASACLASATVEDTVLASSLAEETPLVSQEEAVLGSVLAEETPLVSEDEDDDSDDNKSVTWEELIKRSQESLTNKLFSQIQYNPDDIPDV